MIRRFGLGAAAIVGMLGVGMGFYHMRISDRELATPRVIWRMPPAEYGANVVFLSPKEIAVSSCRENGGDLTFLLRVIDMSGRIGKRFTLGSMKICNLAGAAVDRPLIAFDYLRDDHRAAGIVNTVTGKHADLAADYTYPPRVYGDSQPFSPSGHAVIVVPDRRGIGSPLLVDSSSGRRLRRLDGLGVSAGALIRWTPDGRRLIVLDPKERRLEVEDTAFSQKGVRLPLPSWKERRTVLSADARKVAVFSVRKMEHLVIWAYDTATGKPIFQARQLIGDNQGIESVQWSPDGEKLLVTVRHEDTEDWGRAVYVVALSGKVQAVAFPGWRPIGMVDASSWSPDGRWVAIALWPQGRYRPGAIAVIDTRRWR